MRFAVVALAALFAGGCAPVARQSGTSQAVAWRFDNLQRIGGYQVRVEGQPEAIQTPAGTAIKFDGVDDALFVPAHPLAGAAKFTFEAIFRPDGGAFEQRWFHLAQADPAAPARTYPPVQPSGPRFLFEIRVVEGSWYLDAFTAGPGYSKTLVAPEKRYPVGHWYHVAQTYDGHSYRSYVDGRLQAEAPLAFTPQGPGYSSIGTRINRRNYFHGAIYVARFTPRALAPKDFMKLPAGLESSPKD
jgi:Concanavalin A-like lectin/glucanases superfamily